jgi:prevent-host-death family protein
MRMAEKNVFREMPSPFKHFAEQTAGLKPVAAREVPVKEAKAKLTELLRAAEAGMRIVLTRHGKPVADLVPHLDVPDEKPMSFMERYAAWHAAHPTDRVGWVSPDFDDPLPEDFLLQPLPDDFDEKLAEHDERVRTALEAQKRWKMRD